MFNEDFARERERHEADQRAAEQHEQYIEGLLADKNADINRARYIARQYRGLLWSLNDRGLLSTGAKAEMDRFDVLYGDDIDDEDGDES